MIGCTTDQLLEKKKKHAMILDRAREVIDAILNTFPEVEVLSEFVKNSYMVNGQKESFDVLNKFEIKRGEFLIATLSVGFWCGKHDLRWKNNHTWRNSERMVTFDKSEMKKLIATGKRYVKKYLPIAEAELKIINKRHEEIKNITKRLESQGFTAKADQYCVVVTGFGITNLNVYGDEVELTIPVDKLAEVLGILNG